METLEQKRAKDAWICSQGCQDEYIKIAKGLPALIMNSGLMQVLAFLHQKRDTHEKIAQQLRAWLKCRFEKRFQSANFEPFMEALMDTTSSEYQAITAEAFAWLKWLRQLAATR